MERAYDYSSGCQTTVVILLQLEKLYIYLFYFIYCPVRHT